MPDPVSLNDLLGAKQQGTITKNDPVVPQTGFGSTGFSDLNKYDTGLRRGMDQEELRLSNQSNWQALGNAALQTAGEIGLGTLEGVGYLADLPQWYNLLMGTENEFGNWFSDIMLSGKEAVKDFAPIYGGDKAFDPGNIRWWMANAPNIASSLSLMLPAMGAAKTATWLGTKLGRLGRAIAVAEEAAVAAGKVNKAAQQLKLGVKSALFSRYMENTMEASEAFRSRYDELLSNGMTEDMALQDAAKVGRNVWYSNISNLISDIPQYALLMGGGEYFTKAADRTKKLLGKYKGVAELGAQALSEGAEEAWQFGIQKSAINQKNALSTMADAIRRMPEYAHEDEFWASVTLGAVGGAVFDVAGKVFDAKSQKTMDRYKSAVDAYGNGNWIEGLKQKHDEALDMILDGDTDKLADIVEMSEDERMKPMVERMQNYHNQLDRTIPEGPNKKEVIRKSMQAQFYEDAVNELRQEINTAIADSGGSITMDQVAKFAFDLIGNSNTPHKNRIHSNAMRILGITEDMVTDETTELDGVKGREVGVKVAQLVASMNKNITLNAEARGLEQQQEQQSGGQDGATIQIIEDNKDNPEGLANARGQMLRDNASSSQLRIIDNHILEKIRMEMDSVDPLFFDSKENYFMALRNKPYIGKFGNTVRGRSNNTAMEVAESKWSRAEQQRAQVQTEQEPEVRLADETITSNVGEEQSFGEFMNATAEQTTQEPSEQSATEQQVQEPPSTYGATNQLFTPDAAENARRTLRNSLGQLNMGINPEILQAGITLAGFHIEAGARSFAAYTKAMVKDLGEGIKPYLKMLYNAVRDYPGFNNEGMDDPSIVSAASIEEILKEKEDVETTPNAAYQTKLEEQIAAIRMEPDGQFAATYKPVGLGQESRKYFNSREEATQWLTEQYADEQVRAMRSATEKGDIELDKEEKKEESDEVRDAREVLLRLITFDNTEGQQAEEPSNSDPGNLERFGRKYMYSVTQDVQMERDASGRWKPKFINVDGRLVPQTQGDANNRFSKLWSFGKPGHTRIEGTVTFEEYQDYIRHIDEKIGWQNVEVHLEVDPTIPYHNPANNNSVSPDAVGMDYSEEQISIAKNAFFSANKDSLSSEELNRIWAQEEAYMRMSGARGIDSMNVTYVIYHEGKRIPIGFQLGQAQQSQRFGGMRSSRMWEMRKELWEQWKKDVAEKRVGNTPIRHPEILAIAKDDNGNPVYMAGRFLDHPNKTFSLDSQEFKHETSEGTHLVLMVPVIRGQGFIEEIHTALPDGRIMNAGKYMPGFPYILVKDTMGNYVWSRVYSKNISEAEEQTRGELEKIFEPAIKAKEAFRRRLEQMGIDLDGQLPDDIAAEIRNYRTGKVKRADARFPEVFDFMEFGYKKVQSEFSTLYRWREKDESGVYQYHPQVGDEILFTLTDDRKVNSPFSIDAVINKYQLKNRPLQIDVNRIHDPGYVDSISWRLKTNTDPNHPMVSPTLFFETTGKVEAERSEVATQAPTPYSAIIDKMKSILGDAMNRKGKNDEVDLSIFNKNPMEAFEAIHEFERLNDDVAGVEALPTEEEIRVYERFSHLFDKAGYEWYQNEDINEGDPIDEEVFDITLRTEATEAGGSSIAVGEEVIGEIEQPALFKNGKVFIKGKAKVFIGVDPAQGKLNFEDGDPTIEGKTGKSDTVTRDLRNRRKPPRFKKATDIMKHVLNERAAREWLAKRLPAGIAVRIAKLDVDTWGYTQNALITLSTGAPQTTAYHEAFHAVFWNLATDSERAAIMAEAEKKYGPAPESVDTQEWYEEHMADDFEQYVVDRQESKTTIGRFFKNLWNWIQTAILHRHTIDNFYASIYRGSFSSRRVVSKSFIRYSKTPGLTAQEERDAINVIMQLIDDPIDSAMAAAEKLSKSKVRGRKAPSLAEEYAKVINMEYLFSTDGLIGDLVILGREDFDGNPVAPELREKIKHIIIGLNPTIENINFDTGKIDYHGQTKTVNGEEVFVRDTQRPGPLYFRMLKELSNRGIDVKIKGNKTIFSERANTSSEEDQELEFTEEAEDMREWWTISSVSISPKERLTPRLQRWISRLEQLTEDGYPIPDPFGLGMILTYSPHEVYPILQGALGNSISVDDMIGKINQEAESNPLFASIAAQLEGWQTDNNANQLATQLFTHIAQKVDPQFVVTRQYTNSQGMNRIITFPSGSKKENSITNNFVETMTRMSPKELIALEERFKELIELKGIIPIRDFINAIRRAGHHISSSEAKKIEESQRKDVLRSIRNGINAYNTNREQDAGNIFFRAAKKYIAPITKQRLQNVHLNVNGKKVYAWMNSNFLGRQMMRFANNFQEMVDFYISDPLYAPNGKPLPLLRGDQNWQLRFSDGIKYRGERIGREYTKFSEKDMLVTMLSYFNDGAYLLPVFNDATVLASVKIDRAKDLASSIEDILDVSEAEYMRAKSTNESNVKNYKKNKSKAVMFTELLNDKDGNLIKDFDRDTLRDKLLNILDEQTDQMMGKLKELGIASSIDGMPGPLMDSSITNPRVFVKEFIASHMAVNSQLVLLTTGDPAYYKSIGDFFKRAKEFMSPGIYLNDKAIYTNVDGEVIDLGKKPVMKLGIFSDIVTDSELHQELMDMGLADEYGVFSLTDGQTYIDPISYRDREIGLGRWNDEKDEQLQILMRGELPRKYSMTTSFQPFKPFMFTLLKDATGRIKPFQKKDSEMMIHPFYGRKYVNGKKNNMYNPLHKAMLKKFGFTFTEEEGNTVVGYNPENRQVDMLASEECIKVGLEGVAQFPTKNSAQGNKITDYSNPDDTFSSMEIQDIPTSDWRLQQETPPHHLNSDVIYGIQTMKLIVTDLEPEERYALPNGEVLTGKELLKRYKETISADIGASMENVERMFTEAVTSDEAFDRLMKTLRQEVIDRGMPDRFNDALQVRKMPNGKPATVLPLGHPLHVNRIESLLSSMIRKRVTKRKFDKGYSFVNAAAAGFERMPRIVFNKDGSIKHYEVYAPIHDKRLMHFVNEEGFIDERGMQAIRQDVDMSKLLDGIVYRTPTEGKYSIFPIHIIGFVPTDDGVIFMPPEMTRIAGLDFDIDKVRGFYYAVSGRKGKLTNQQERDNRKLDLMRGAISTPEVAKQMLNPGSFAQIEKTNLEIRKRKNWDKIQNKQIKTHDDIDAVESGLSYTNPMTQVLMSRRFNAGQDLIGIAAVNNAVHAIWTQLENPLSYAHSVSVNVSGKLRNLSQLNNRYDINGNEITKNIASTVAAFVDNGKNPQADHFNMNEHTANIAYYLLHLGVDLELVQYFLAQPGVITVVNDMINNGGKVSSRMMQIIMRNGKLESRPRAWNRTHTLDRNNLYRTLSRTAFVEETKGSINVEAAKAEFGNAPEETKDLKAYYAEKRFYQLQYQHMADFLIYAARANDVNTLSQLTKAGDKGLGSTQVDNRKVINGYHKFASRKRNPFTGWEQIFNADKEYMAKFLFNGIFRANDLIVQLLRLPNLGSLHMELLFDYLEDIKGETLIDDDVNMIYRSMYDYIASADPDFTMEDGLGRKLWNQIQELDRGYVEGNALLASLRMSKEDLHMPGGTLLDYGEEALMTDHWKKLAIDHPQLAKDLARYSVMRNGFRYANDGFSHLQPIDLYMQFFPEMYDRYEQALSEFMTNPEKLLNYADQFIRNNYNKSNIVRDAPAGSTMFITSPDTKATDGSKIGALVVARDEGRPMFYKWVDVEKEGNNEYLFKLVMEGQSNLYYEWTPGYGSLDKASTYQEYYFNRGLDEEQSSIFAKELPANVSNAMRQFAVSKAQEAMEDSQLTREFLDACK